jgi:hypothetical protein
LKVDVLSLKEEQRKLLDRLGVAQARANKLAEEKLELNTALIARCQAGIAASESKRAKGPNGQMCVCHLAVHLVMARLLCYGVSARRSAWM